MLLSLWPLLALALTPCAAIKWISCDFFETTKLIQLNLNEAIGIRSYDWPNSMTLFNGQQRQNCSIMVQNTILTTQRIAMVFLNARLGAVFNGQYPSQYEPQNVDTNNFGLNTYYDFDESFTFAVSNWTNYNEKTTVSVWNGFEAIVIGYDQSTSCSFQTDEPTVVEPNDPKFLTAFIDTDPSLPLSSCSWKYVPKDGYTLKFAVSNIIYETKLVVTVDGVVQPYASGNTVYYATKSLKVTYDRDGTQYRERSFFGILSSFLTQPSDSSQCPEKTHSLNDPTLSLTISVNRNTQTGAFWTPYADNENCVSQIQTEKNKELRFYVDARDIERSDTALLVLDTYSRYNIRTDDLSVVLATKDNDTATLTWKSDGNYGRSGFSLHVDVLDCSCGSNLITLSSSTPKVVFGPSKPYYKSGVAQDLYKPYCRNMTCIWTVDRPDDSIVLLTLVGQVRTFIGDMPQDILQIRSDGAQKMTQWRSSQSTQNFFVFAKELQVGLRSSDQWPTWQSDDHDLHFEASFLAYSDITAHKTVFKTSADYSIFETSTLSKQFSAHTFVLGPDMASKKIQIYMVQNDMWCNYQDFDGFFGMLDGELSTNAAPVFWPQNCSQRYPFNSMRVAPFVSKTGSVTIMRLHQHQTKLPTLIVKVYDEEIDCTLQDPLLVVKRNYGRSLKWSPTSNKTNQTRCPAYVYVDEPGFPSINFQFSIYNRDSPTQVFAGFNISGTPLFMADSDSTPTVYGRLFTLYTRIDYTLHIRPELRDVNYYSKNSKDGHAVRGVFMSPGYPLESSNTSSVLESLTIRPPLYYQNRKGYLNGTLTVVIDELKSTSSLAVTLGSKILPSFKSTAKGTTVYSVSTSDNIVFAYNGSLAEKGFFIRYELKAFTYYAPGSSSTLKNSSVLSALLIFAYQLF
ncbi:hypothetical protein L596_026390 [Steinernema carpocapsae]|uniref:CUB domain-containing protein n=1 Tax=Steinernema carpocapsae TaxID=34508 RepID=A0A4U5M176_STECR|nr:hypothetical protein L596_026390 [Steinernema carpocapsae]